MPDIAQQPVPERRLSSGSGGSNELGATAVNQHRGVLALKTRVCRVLQRNAFYQNGRHGRAVYLADLVALVLTVVARRTLVVLTLLVAAGMAVLNSERRKTALTAKFGTNGLWARIR